MELIIMRSLTLNFYTDPGHGWAKVNKKVLNDLGIAEDISAYSYMRGDYAYLEEDCDLGRLMAAAQAAGINLKLREQCSRERSSKIRSYRPYRTYTQAAAAEAALKARIRAQGCSLDFIENRMIIKVIG
jgi:hypothetical protein